MAQKVPGLEEERFDAVILGTGLPESILSASLSLSGARVLHLDPNDCYGSHHATISLSKLCSLAISGPAPQAEPRELPTAGASPALRLAPGGEFKLPLRDLPTQLFPKGADVRVGDDNIVKSVGDRVQVDFGMRTVLGGGKLVDILIQTGVGHYLSFRPLDASYLFFESGETSEEASSGCLRRVPASRSDVFQSKFLSMLEKRLFMRFVKREGVASARPDGSPTSNADDGSQPLGTSTAEEPDAVEDALFEDRMEEEKLSENLRSFVRHCLAFTEDVSPVRPAAISAQEGFGAIETYLKSLQRYKTPTPFLYPNYGCGEYCEAFCRLSAVHGGTFMLRKTVERFVAIPEASGSHSSEGAEEVAAPGIDVELSDGEHVHAGHVFISSGLLDCEFGRDGDCGRDSTWKYVALLSNSALPEDYPRGLVVFPKGRAGNTNATVRVLQMNSTAEVCPDGMYSIYAETVGPGATRSDVASAVSLLVKDESLEGSLGPARWSTFDDDDTGRLRPDVGWSVVYSRSDISKHPQSEIDGCFPLPAGFTLVKDVGSGVDASVVLSEARRCFGEVRPGVEFYAKPVIDNDSGQQNSDTEGGEPTNGHRDSAADEQGSGDENNS